MAQAEGAIPSDADHRLSTGRVSHRSTELLMSDKNARLERSEVRFARSATRHRITKKSIRHVMVSYRVRFEEIPPADGPVSLSVRVVYLGEDEHGQELEVMAIPLEGDEQLVIHAMPMRAKYRRRYEEVGRD
ncbi:MAG TPA: hypothetical protein VIH92_02115 [Solirubrobacteraceae bacterium]